MPHLELESQILHKLMNIKKWVSTLFLFPRKRIGPPSSNLPLPKKRKKKQNNNAGIF